MPRLVATPRPRAGTQSRAVRHQAPDGHLSDVAERIVDLAQFRHVLDGRIIEREPPPVAQLQDGDAGQRLGDRCPVIDRLVVHGPFRREILVADVVLCVDLAAFDEQEAAADDADLLDSSSVQGGDARPCVAGSGCALDQRRENRERQSGPASGDESESH